MTIMNDFTRKEYIEREAAKAKLCGMCRWEGTTNCEECEHPIDDIPAADVVPVRHGKNVSESGFVCSVCGFGDFDGFHGYKPRYCPNCGARMDLEGVDE